MLRRATPCLRAGAPSRSFAQRVRPASPMPPLSEPLVRLTSNAGAVPIPKFSLSRTRNGITIASEETTDPLTSISLLIRGGTRDQTASTMGVNHLIHRLGLKIGYEKNWKNPEDFCRMLLRKSYSGDILRDHLPLMLDVLSDILKNPAFHPEELEAERQLLPSLLEDYNREPASFLPDIFRSTAFGGKTLGLPSVCPEEALPGIGVDKLRDWMKQFVVGNNLVIAASGVEHQRLVSLVEQYFGDMPEGSPTLRERAVYVGGLHLLPGEPKEHATALPTTHLLLGFQAPPLHDKGYYGAALLNSLMGGGKNFSSGGPGKGMYTVLNMRILNRWHWAQSVECFYHAYADSGLFGIAAQAVPESAGQMIDALCHELYLMSTSITDADLQRAKNQLKSSIYMNLESRRVQADDAALQVLYFGERVSVDDLCARIDSWDQAQLYVLAKKMLASAPTVVACGMPESLRLVPTANSISQKVLGVAPSPPRGSFFGWRRAQT